MLRNLTRQWLDLSDRAQKFTTMILFALFYIVVIGPFSIFARVSDVLRIGSFDSKSNWIRHVHRPAKEHLKKKI
jgi:hypothetical protein